MAGSSDDGTVKPVYPHLAVSNKAVLTIYYIIGQSSQVFFETRKQAEEAIAWIGQELGRTPNHDIRDII